MSGSTMPYYRRWLDQNPGVAVPVAFDVDGLSDLAWDAVLRSDERTLVGLMMEFGPCRPPFDDMWLEIEARPGVCQAAYVRHRTLPDGFTGDLSHITERILKSGWDIISEPESAFIPVPVAIPEGGGVAFLEIPVWYAGGDLFGNYFTSVAFDEMGRVITVSSFACTSREPNSDALLLERIDGAKLLASTALFACAVMHCKNVTTREEHLPRQLRRDRERRGLPDIVYRTLVVGPSPGQSGGKSTPKPEKTTRLHLCRGHFAEYGPDYGKGKLFGRLEGRYWVPPHVKGSTENGRVEKTYRVEAA